MSAPVVLGAGPAGCLAATLLARAGGRPVLVDRHVEVGDALCGGFMSWRTVARLRDNGLDVAELGAHRVMKLALFSGGREAHNRLPAAGYGLSRHALDTAMRAQAVEAGATLAIDRIRSVEPGIALGDTQDWCSDALFLASGKYDVRGLPRPRAAEDAALGLRIRLPGSAELTKLLANTIELHFFAGGYAGIVLQEERDGHPSANVCLALRKSRLAMAGGTPAALFAELGREYPAFGSRMAFAPDDIAADTIGAVPYGWIARDTAPGLFRLGDQAAVIPSLAGEGMAIALASAEAAVRSYTRGGGAAAPRYQRAFARQAFRPVKTAKAIWNVAETARGGATLTTLARTAPPLATLAMRASRIG
ncbi:MAG: FAD-dependent monooxygenase [Parerythrobacter sp.]